MTFHEFIVRAGHAQEIGARPSQQDSLGISDLLNFKFIAHAGSVGVLADGMGGYEDGKLSSETAVNAFLEAYSEKTSDEPIRDALMRALFAANDAIIRLSPIGEPAKKTGTTLVAVVIHEGQLHWISVGDSRAYLARDETIVQLTTDHTYLTELQREVQKGSLSKEEALEHPDREVLTSYVGHGDLTDIDCSFKPLRLKTDDTIILCSDGLYRAISTDAILESLEGHPQEIADRLIRRALEANVPRQDNVSAVVFFCDDEGAKEHATEDDLDSNIPVFTSTSRFAGFAVILIALIGLALLAAIYLRGK